MTGLGRARRSGGLSSIGNPQRSITSRGRYLVSETITNCSCPHTNTVDATITAMEKSREVKRGSKASVREIQENSNKAVKEVSVGAPGLLRRLSSRPAQSQAQTHTQTQTQTHTQTQTMGLFSLKGLMAAQKFSKGLRQRAALKLAARKAPPRKPIVIVNEQVPAGSARPTERFPCALASRMLQDFLSSRLEGVGYSAPCCGSLVTALSEEVRSLVKTVCHDRYRLVCTVTLGQVGQQGSGGILLASRCLWDPHTDTCVSHTYQNRELFCTTNVYAVYYE